MAHNEIARTAPLPDATLRLSSRGLGWGPVKMERRDVPPGQYAFPEGVPKHQVFLSLSPGRALCERAGGVKQIDARPGTVVLQPAGMPAIWRTYTRVSFAVLLLDPDFLADVARSCSDEASGPVELQTTERNGDPVIANIASVLSRELVSLQSGSQIYAESLGRVLAVHLLRHYRRGAVPVHLPSSKQTEAAVPAAVTRAMRYLQAHFAADITLDELARAACCSSFHLSRQFKQALGMTPFQYLLQLRVDHARHLVMAGAGEHSLAEVARAAGFADQSHLTRQMKRLLGVTPGTLKAA